MNRTTSGNKNSLALAARVASAEKLPSFLKALYDDLRKTFSQRTTPRTASEAKDVLALVKLYWALVQTADQDSYSQFEDFQDFLAAHFSDDQRDEIVHLRRPSTLEPFVTRLQKVAHARTPKKTLTAEDFRTMPTLSSIMARSLGSPVYTRFSDE